MSETSSKPRHSSDGDSLFEGVVSADVMQTTVSLVEALVDECHLYFDDDGIHIPAMDPATVAAIDLILKPDAFESYETDGAHVGVNVPRFSDIVGMAERDQLISLTLDAETRKLVIRIGELTYTLALLDPETVRSPPDRSNVEFESTGEVVTDAETISRAVTAADMVSSHVTLGIDAEEELFYAEADGDTDDVSLAVPADDLAGFTPGDAHALFSIDYLSAIDRAMPRDLDVELELGVDIPLAMHHSFAEGAGVVDYLVSPRIARS